MKKIKKTIYILSLLFILCFILNNDNVYAAECTTAKIGGLNNKVVVGNSEVLHFDLEGCFWDNLSYVDLYLSSHDGKIASIDSVSTGSATVSNDKQTVKNVNGAGTVTIKAEKSGTLSVKACLHGKNDSKSCNTKQVSLLNSRCESMDIQSVEKQLDYGERNDFHVEVAGCLDTTAYLDFYMSGPATFYSTPSGTISSDKKSISKSRASSYVKMEAGSSDGYATIVACLHGEDPQDPSSVCQSTEVAIGNSKPRRQKSFTFEDTEIEIKVGEEETADLNFNSNNSTVKCGVGEEDELTWSTSDSKIAIATNGGVNCEHGKIKGVSPGVATIKACLISNPQLCSSIRIIVKGDSLSNKDESKITSFSFKKTTVAVKVADQEKVDLTFTPNIDENGVILVPYITEGDKKTNGSSSNRVAVSDSGCLTASTDKGKVYLSLNKKCDVNPVVKVCLSTDPTKCSTNDLTVTYGGTANDHIGQDGNSIFAASKFSLLYDEDKEYTCEGLLDENLVAVIKFALKIVRIVVPILLILLCTIDFAQVVFSGSDRLLKREGYQDSLQKAVSRSIRRALAAVAIFFIPLLVNVVLDMPGISEKTDSDCGIMDTE